MPNDVKAYWTTPAYCKTLYVDELSQWATSTQITWIFGATVDVDVLGLGGAFRVGVAYGRDGDFGCFISGCGGVTSQTLSVELSVYAGLNVGPLKAVTDAEFVAYAGFDVPLAAAAAAETDNPELLELGTGSSIGITFDESFNPIGGEIAFTYGASAVPVNVGIMYCPAVNSFVQIPAAQ